MELDYAKIRDANQARQEKLRPWMKKSGKPYRNKIRKNRLAHRESISPGLRHAVLRRDRGTCRYCGDFGGAMHIDHVVPVALGGSSTLGNLVAACQDCNLKKGTKLWKPLPIHVAFNRQRNKVLH